MRCKVSHRRCRYRQLQRQTRESRLRTMADPSPVPDRATLLRNLALGTLALVAVGSIGIFMVQTFWRPAATTDSTAAPGPTAPGATATPGATAAPGAVATARVTATPAPL